MYDLRLKKALLKIFINDCIDAYIERTNKKYSHHDLYVMVYFLKEAGVYYDLENEEFFIYHLSTYEHIKRPIDFVDLYLKDKNNFERAIYK